jgi:hypothetical protein
MYKGAPPVEGKRVTGFTNGEEEAVHLTHVVPFLVEDELKRTGGLYEKAPDWGELRDCGWPPDNGAESRVLNGGNTVVNPALSVRTALSTMLSSAWEARWSRR